MISAQAAKTLAPEAAYAESAYQAAKVQLAAKPKDAETAWKFASACFDRAEFAINNNDRAALGNEGIKAMRALLERDPNSAPGHYYLAMDIGEVAQTKKLKALAMVAEMEKEFLRAKELDEKFDYAGADRNLGVLYMKTPGWPTSIGDQVKAKAHLLRAVELAPEYPENHLNLMDGFLKWNNRTEAEKEIVEVRKVMAEAKRNFPGEQWASSRDDWRNRFAKIELKLAEGPAMLAPHNRK